MSNESYSGAAGVARQTPIGKPRPGTRFEGVGTLHGDGMFEPTVPVQPGSLLAEPLKPSAHASGTPMTIFTRHQTPTRTDCKSERSLTATRFFSGSNVPSPWVPQLWN